MQKGLYYVLVPLPAGPFLEDGHSGLGRHGPPIGAIGGPGLVGVGYGQDARAQGDGLAAQLARITAAVPTLVVVQDDGHQGVQRSYRVQDIAARSGWVCIMAHSCVLIVRHYQSFLIGLRHQKAEVF